MGLENKGEPKGNFVVVLDDLDYLRVYVRNVEITIDAETEGLIEVKAWQSGDEKPEGQISVSYSQG